MVSYMKEMENQLNTGVESDIWNIKCISLFLSAIVSFLWFNYASKLSIEGTRNIMLYFIGIAILFAFYYSFYMLLRFESTLQHKFSKFREVFLRFFVISAVIIEVLYFVGAYLSETVTWNGLPNNYIRHKMSIASYVVILILTFAVLYIHLKERTLCAKKRCVAIRIMFASAVVFLQGLMLYAPNFLKITGGGPLHADAYTTSIINVLHGMPYEDYSSPVYGHYGLILAPFVKILNMLGLNEWLAVSISIVIIGIIAFGLNAIVLSRLVDSDFLFCISLMATAVVSFQIQTGEFWQLIPHRLLFQSVILFVISSTFGEHSLKMMSSDSEVLRCYSKKKILLGWVLVSIGMIWNPDVGIICCVIWICCCIYAKAKRNGKYDIYIVFFNLLYAVAAFIVGWCVVNIYNILVGGSLIDLRTYLFPLLDSNYTKMIQHALPNAYGWHFYAFLLFGGAIVWFLPGVFKISIDSKKMLCVAAATMGLGTMIYYINRPAFGNACIAIFSVVLICAYILNSVDFKDAVNKSARWICTVKEICIIVFPVLIAISSMLLGTLSSFGKEIEARTLNEWDRKGIESFVGEIDASLPDDTVAFGFMTSQLMAYMDRKTGIYTTDWENIIMPHVEYLNELLRQNEYNHLLVCSYQAEYVPENYRVVNEFQYGDYKFYLYDNNNY